MRTTHEEECGRARDELFLAQCNREDGRFNPGNADEAQSRFGVKKPKKTEMLGDAKQPNTFTVSTMNYRAGMLAGILQPKQKQKQEKSDLWPRKHVESCMIQKWTDTDVAMSVECGKIQTRGLPEAVAKAHGYVALVNASMRDKMEKNKT